MTSQYIKGIGVTKGGDIDVLTEVTIPKPQLAPEDILVQIKGVALNPVDYKVRGGLYNHGTEQNPQILGYDGSGVVVELGSNVKGFKVGDEVFYAGNVARNGTLADYHAVDHRIVGKKPTKIGFAEAASVPLVWITAYEALVDNVGISTDPKKNEGKTLLIVAGAGGVGSVAIQLAKKVLGLKVIATASRTETIEFVKKLGADVVINHRNPLRKEFDDHKLADVDYVFHTWDLDNDYLGQLVNIAKPFAKIAYISPAPGTDLGATFGKAQQLVPEMMFARPLYGVEPERQGEILNIAAKLIDEGTIINTATKIEKYSLDAIKEGHKTLASGKTIGKLAYKLE